MNLYNETVKILSEHYVSFNEILFVKDGEHNYLIDNNSDRNALRRVLNVDYDEGYGSQIINDELMLVGERFWLERHEYDGAEWWEFKTLPSYSISLEVRSTIDDLTVFKHRKHIEPDTTIETEDEAEDWFGTNPVNFANAMKNGVSVDGKRYGPSSLSFHDGWFEVEGDRKLYFYKDFGKTWSLNDSTTKLFKL